MRISKTACPSPLQPWCRPQPAAASLDSLGAEPPRSPEDKARHGGHPEGGREELEMGKMLQEGNTQEHRFLKAVDLWVDEILLDDAGIT